MCPKSKAYSDAPHTGVEAFDVCALHQVVENEMLIYFQWRVFLKSEYLCCILTEVPK
jgi:hypothetical protein